MIHGPGLTPSMLPQHARNRLLPRVVCPPPTSDPIPTPLLPSRYLRSLNMPSLSTRNSLIGTHLTKRLLLRPNRPRK